MREIKIRYFFKDSDDKLHILTEDIKEIEFHTDIPDNIKHGWELVARTEYTGLKDSKVREIYEGDIYKQEWKGKPVTGEIVYSDTAAFCLKPYEHYYIDVIRITGEVIGNIYENPELVKRTK